MSERLLSIQEAAELVACHPATLRRAIARGELAALKVGSRYRVRLADLQPEVLGSRPEARAPREPSGRLSRIAAEIARTGGRSAGA